MSTRPCARCGARIPTDQHLCADCREERPVAPPVVGQEPAGADRAQPLVATRPTWRGRAVPRGMVLPSGSQYHGTMFALVAAAVVVTMAAAVLVNKGVGPFTVTQIQPSRSGIVVSVTGFVRNGGTHPGRARCVATWTSSQGGLQQTGVVQTPMIDPGKATTVAITLRNITVVPSDVGIDCR